MPAAAFRGGDLARDGRDVSGCEPLAGAREQNAMSENPFSLWVYLSQSPLLWLTVTLLTYAVTDAVSLRTHRHPLANPAFDVDYRVVPADHRHVVHDVFRRGATRAFLLGPATVALAVPLYQNRKQVAAAILPMLAALVMGSITAIVSVVLLAEMAGLPRAIILSLAPKSVTAGVAMGIAESLHADPSLTAVAVVLTGIMGAVIVTPLMNRVGITDFSRARIRGWYRGARHRHGPRISGRRGRGRRHRYEPQRARNIAVGAAGRDAAGALIFIALSVLPP
jgi:putative effector of murein hydrolase